MTFERLTSVAANLGIHLDEAMLQRLDAYRSLLLEANAQFNLTRITDPDEMEIRLFADSLVLLPLLPEDTTRLLDLGSGGGVPGIPLAITRPALGVTLVDATAKKVRFLADTATALGLTNVTAIQGRAEELARDRQHRERYDAVTARAVARLVTLVELSLPFVKPGGRAILPKGSAADEELQEAQYAIRMLGGRSQPIVASAIEGTRMIVVDKLKPVSEQFPRRTGVPNKTPLLGPGSR